MKEYNLTFAEAGDLVGKQFTTIARYVREGKLDAVEIENAGQYKPRFRVNREDVLAIWEAKKRVYAEKRRERNRATVPRTENSSKRIDHTGEVWQVFNGSDTPIFDGTFDECLKHKRPHETMRMVGGQRGVNHTTTPGHQ